MPYTTLPSAVPLWLFVPFVVICIFIIIKRNIEDEKQEKESYKHLKEKLKKKHKIKK